MIIKTRIASTLFNLFNIINMQKIKKTLILNIILLVFVFGISGNVVLAETCEECCDAISSPDKCKLACTQTTQLACEASCETSLDKLICKDCCTKLSNGSPAPGTIIKFTNPIHADNIQELIASVTTWLITFGLAIAVLMLIYGGLLFVTAAGSEEKVTNARRILTWSVVGIAVLLLAKGIEFVIRSFLS